MANILEPFGEVGLADVQAGEQFQIDLLAVDGLKLIFHRAEERVPVVVFRLIGLKGGEIKTGFCRIVGSGVEQVLGGHDKGFLLAVIAKGWLVFQHLPSRFHDRTFALVGFRVKSKRELILQLWLMWSGWLFERNQRYSAQKPQNKRCRLGWWGRC